MTHHSTSAIAVLTVLAAATPATAQPAPSPSSDAVLAQGPAGGLRVSKLVGVEVVGMDHERVGRTEEIIVDASGGPTAVVIGVGGFLGIGEKRVAVRFDQITWTMGDAGVGREPRSSTVPATAPSGKAADTAGPQTMPGAQVSNDVLTAIDEKRGGAVDDATGSVAAKDQRGRATVAVAGSDDGPARAEIRMTKAALQAAPAFRYRP